MANYFNQYARRISIGKEATYGAIAAMGRYIPVEEIKLDYVYNDVPKNMVGKYRADTQMYKREAVLTPSLTMAADGNEIGELLYSFFGTITSGTNLAAAGTQYKHTFAPVGTIADTFASVTIKYDYEQGTVFDYLGIRGNKITLEATPKSEVKLMYEGIGQREANGTAAPAAVVYGTWKPFLFSDMSVELDGTVEGGVYNMSHEWNNNLSEGFRLGTMVYAAKPLPNGKFEAHCKFSIEYKHVDRLRYLTDMGSYVGLKVTYTGQTISGTGKNEMVVRYPKGKIMTAPYEYQDGLLALAVDFQALDGGTSAAGTGDSVIVELFNNVNTY